MIWLVVFGMAFAFVEAAVVIYLRKLLGYEAGYSQTNYHVFINLGFIAFISPENSLLGGAQLSLVEIIREFATIMMLLAVSALAGKNLKQRVGAFLIAFSIWDVFYYLFLKILVGWPRGLFDQDIFFLIPVPWIGPVITPIAVSILFFVLGCRLFIKKDD